MAVVLPGFAYNNQSNKLRICGLGKMGNIMHVQVNKLVVLEKLHLALLILDKPIVELGWAGITYL